MATLTSSEDSSSVDWQTTKQTVRDRTAFLFNNSLMSDIKFVVTDSKRESDDSTQVRVPAHKLVLAISSPVFEAMFYGDLAEKGEEIELPDTEWHYLVEFLRFLYCDANEVRLTIDNAFGVLYLAQKYIVPLLVDKCWSFIDENTCACLKSDAAVSTLNHGNLASLLQRESLHIPKELDLFDAVKHWAEAKSKQEDLEPTGEAVRKILGEAVYLIRFPTISLQDFARHVVPSGILTDTEALEIHQYHSLVNPAIDVKFPVVYREGISSDAELHECCRALDVTLAAPAFCKASPFFGNLMAPAIKKKKINESIEVMVMPTNVHLKGVYIITTVSNPFTEYSSEVRLLDGNGDELAAQTGSFMAMAAHEELTSTTSGIVVNFQHPILMWKSCTYKIQVKVDVDAQLQLKKDLSNFVKADGLYFNFEGRSRHIYKLLFHKLD